MTQPDVNEQALSYIRHQAAKSLAELAALMERTGADCARCLEGVSQEQAGFRPVLSRSPERSEGAAEGPLGEWSIKEVLGHVLGSVTAVNREIANLVEGRPPQVERPRMGIVSGAEEAIHSLRGALRDLWQETERLVVSLPEDGSLERTWEHPLFGPLNFREWIAFQRLHALDHIQQIEKIKADPSYPSS